MPAELRSAAMEATGESKRPPIAEAISVSKRFGATQALRDVTLKVLAGESHALVGRNGAGKSTLVSILTGMIDSDEGKVRFEGEPSPPVEARSEWQARVACVYQKPTVVPNLTVAENLFLNASPTRRFGVINWRKMRVEATSELAAWGIDVDVRVPAGTLSVEKRQLVEIVRALKLGSRFIILDEPTAQLESREIGRLFEHIGELKRAGVTFLYISHYLPEIYEICEVVTVLRNGERVVTDRISAMPKDRVVAAMVGSAEPERKTAGAGTRITGTRKRVASSDAVLELSRLTASPHFADVSLEVAEGESVGLAGQRSSGVIAVGEAIVGLRRAETGQIRVGGSLVRGGRVHEALRAGVSFVPDDRHRRGFVDAMSVEENVTMSIYAWLAPCGV